MDDKTYQTGASGRRATLQDLARMAGVGVATVDRVLNGRARVRPATAERVLAAAEALDYHAHGLMRRRLAELAPQRRLGFILQKEQKWFYRALADELAAAAAGLVQVRASVETAFVGSLSPDLLAAQILELAEETDAIGLVAVDHPRVSAAIARVAGAVPVFALLSPLSAPDIAGYIGIDGRKAGRTAGWVISHLVPEEAEVGILVGSHRYLGHEALEAGFRSYMREFAPSVTLRDSVVYLDDRAVAFEAASELLHSVPDLGGIYHVGGGTTGVIRALDEAGRGRGLRYICHDLSPPTARALVDGTVDLVIEAPLSEIARVATAAMVGALGTRPANAPLEPVAFRLVTPENL